MGMLDDIFVLFFFRPPMRLESYPQTDRHTDSQPENTLLAGYEYCVSETFLVGLQELIAIYQRAKCQKLSSRGFRRHI